jgi:serine/threonine protein kinase
LLERLGTGGAGEAFLARSLDPSRNIPVPVVLKRLHRQLVDTENFVRRFLHEAEIAINTDSPHVARVYDVGGAAGTFYMAMEYVPGWTLTTVLTALVDAGRFPAIPLVTRMVSQALIGLSSLHSARDEDGRPLGFIHRDIAPKNIMIGDDGVVRIIDLGLGKSNVQDWRTATGTMLGSVGYMAPEQITGGDVDQRADLYAMGVVLYELLTVHRFIRFGPVMDMVTEALGKKLERPSKLRPDVPPELDDIVERAMAPKARDRFPSAEHFLHALHKASPPQTSIEEIRRFLRALLGRQIVDRRNHVDELLAAPVPKAHIGASDTVILQVRRGVSESFTTTERDVDEDAEPTTAPATFGIDESEAPTFGQDESEVPTYDSEIAETRRGLAAIPQAVTEPSGAVPVSPAIPAPAVTSADEASPLAVAKTIRDLRSRALGLRSTLALNDPRRRPLNEVLAHVALVNPDRPTRDQIASLKELDHRLGEMGI